MAADTDRPRLLARRVRRRHLHLRRRPLPRLDRRRAPQRTDRRHGRDTDRPRLLARRRPTAASSPSATRTSTARPAASRLQPPDRRHGRRRRPATATGSSPPTAASSPSATPNRRIGGRRRDARARSRHRGHPVEEFPPLWLVSADGSTHAFGRAARSPDRGSRRYQHPGSRRLATRIAPRSRRRLRAGTWSRPSSVPSASRPPRPGRLTPSMAAPTRSRAAGAHLPSLGGGGRAAHGLDDRLATVIRMNAERVADHLAPLDWDPRSPHARKWADALLSTDSFHHQNLKSIAVAARAASRSSAEPVRGRRLGRDADAAHLGLVHAAVHRANMLLTEASSVGIGATCLAGNLVVVRARGAGSAPRTPRPAAVCSGSTPSSAGRPTRQLQLTASTPSRRPAPRARRPRSPTCASASAIRRLYRSASPSDEDPRNYPSPRS